MKDRNEVLVRWCRLVGHIRNKDVEALPDYRVVAHFLAESAPYPIGITPEGSMDAWLDAVIEANRYGKPTPPKHDGISFHPKKQRHARGNPFGAKL